MILETLIRQLSKRIGPFLGQKKPWMQSVRPNIYLPLMQHQDIGVGCCRNVV